MSIAFWEGFLCGGAVVISLWVGLLVLVGVSDSFGFRRWRE